MAGQKTQKQNQSKNTNTPKSQNRFGNPQNKSTEKKANDGTEQPGYALDITEGFNPDENWLVYLRAFNKKNKNKFAEIPVILPDLAEGMIYAKIKSDKNDQPVFQLKDSNQYIPMYHLPFLGDMPNLKPVVSVKLKSDNVLEKLMSFSFGEEGTLTSPQKMLNTINKNLSHLGIKQFTPLVGEVQNSIIGNKLSFQINDFNTTIDGYVSATGSLGVVGKEVIFDVQAKIEVEGMAEGELNITRNEKGEIYGKADIEATIANMKGHLLVVYDNGAITIQGTAAYDSPKFSGTITLLVTDAAAADEATNSEIGGEKLATPAIPLAEGTPSTKKKGNQVLVGWGDVTAQITDWLDGEAKIVVDRKGHVTITGKVTPAQGDVELMAANQDTLNLFKFEVKYIYGIPLLGNIFIKGKIELDLVTVFGPLLLQNVEMTGTYSTDPNVLQDFSITGDLRLSAYAALVLTASVEAGLTFIGHELGAGISGYAGLALETYAEAKPTFLYQEEMTEGGKVGESHLKGRLEAAAQLALKLGGEVYFFVNAPWWSPLSDDKWSEPLGEVSYPIGDSIGVAAEVDWKVGSDEIPKLTMDEVDFDAGKFTGDLMEDKKQGTKNRAERKQKGEWKEDPGDTKETEGGENGENEEKPLTDEQKYTKALSELEGFAGEKEDGGQREVPRNVLLSKMNRVKRQYGIDTIKLKKTFWGTPYIYIKHKKQNNDDYRLYVVIGSDSEHREKINKAKSALKKLMKSAIDQDGMLTKAKSIEIGDRIASGYEVIEKVVVTDGGKTWNFNLDDGGDKMHLVKGMPKAESKVPPLTEKAPDVPSNNKDKKSDKESKKTDKTTPPKVGDDSTKDSKKDDKENLDSEKDKDSTDKSKEDKEQDKKEWDSNLTKALKEAKKAIEENDFDLQKSQKSFKKIKSKYDLTSLSANTIRDEKIIIKAKINPEKEIIFPFQIPGLGGVDIQEMTIDTSRPIQELFAINIGNLKKVSKKHDQAYLGQVISKSDNGRIGGLPKKYSNEAFETPEDAKERFSLVIGLNELEDFDDTNKNKVRSAKSKFTQNSYPLGVIGLLWTPNWQVQETLKSGEKKTNKLSVKRLREKVKSIEDSDEQKSLEKDIKNLEGKVKGKKAIPYGRLRDKVNQHSISKKFSKDLRQNANDVFVHTGDADVVSLRVSGEDQSNISDIFDTMDKPLFKVYDEIIKDNSKNGNKPALVSGGYRFKSDKIIDKDVDDNDKIGDQLRAIANQIDQEFRQAVGKIDPKILYFPEPNTLVKLNPDQESIEVSFGVGGNEGETMMKNLLKARGLTDEEIVFTIKAGITTESDRFGAKLDSESDPNINGKVLTYKVGDVEIQPEGMTLDKFKSLFQANQMHAGKSRLVTRIKENINYHPDQKLNISNFETVLGNLYTPIFPHTSILGKRMGNKTAWNSFKSKLNKFKIADKDDATANAVNKLMNFYFDLHENASKVSDKDQKAILAFFEIDDFSQDPTDIIVRKTENILDIMYAGSHSIKAYLIKLFKSIALVPEK